MEKILHSNIFLSKGVSGVAENERNELLTTLEESIRGLQRLLRRTALDQGLTGPQFGFLRLLQESRSARISELAAATGVGASSISGIVTRLEKLALIYRVRSAEDRRVVDVHITEKGERLVTGVLADRLAVLENCYAHLGTQDLSQLVEILSGFNAEAGV
jgi:DNA-binding MarR family transcriptional regulator